MSMNDSELTSVATSSPQHRAVYYVQSPSRDSHEGEKTTNSLHSTPVLSPMASLARDSSSTRYSDSLKPTASQKSSNDSGRHHHHHHHHRKGGKEFDAIEEEGLLGEDGGRRVVPRRCYFLAFVVGFIVLFSLFALILWGASRNQTPVVTMRSIVFDKFVIQAGSDNSGVNTEMINLNSTIKMIFHNKGTFFGVHVTSTPLDLVFSQLTIARGSMKRFYQSRSSEKTVTVMLLGSNIPLYGGGVNLGSRNGKPVTPVPLALNFTVRAKAYILGHLVKPKFYKRVQCALVLDTKKMNVAIPLKNKCTYD